VKIAGFMGCLMHGVYKALNSAQHYGEIAPSKAVIAGHGTAHVSIFAPDISCAINSERLYGLLANIYIDDP